MIVNQGWSNIWRPAASASNQGREVCRHPWDPATPIWSSHGTKRGIVLISIRSHCALYNSTTIHLCIMMATHRSAQHFTQPNPTVGCHNDRSKLLQHQQCNSLKQKKVIQKNKCNTSRQKLYVRAQSPHTTSGRRPCFALH